MARRLSTARTVSIWIAFALSCSALGHDSSLQVHRPLPRRPQGRCRHPRPLRPRSLQPHRSAGGTRAAPTICFLSTLMASHFVNIGRGTRGDFGVVIGNDVVTGDLSLYFYERRDGKTFACQPVQLVFSELK